MFPIDFGTNDNKMKTTFSLCAAIKKSKSLYILLENHVLRSELWKSEQGFGYLSTIRIALRWRVNLTSTRVIPIINNKIGIVYKSYHLLKYKRIFDF